MKKLFYYMLFVYDIAGNAIAQNYDVNKNSHSHDDYAQIQPFYTAYGNRFASLEIEVFLVDDELYVAHDGQNINRMRTIDSLY